MTALIGVYGAAGCGRGIMPIVRAQNPGARAVFIDDGAAPGPVNSHGVLSWPNFLAVPGGAGAVCLAIASPKVRERLAGQCDDAGIPLIGARHGSVVEMDDVCVGEGACLSPFVTLTSNIRIGRAFHANLYSYVEHDCRIGDFVTFAPGAKCNGNVHIGDRAYVGSGAVIRQGRPDAPLRIGADAVIGAGAVVLADVPPGTTVVGNPARPLPRDRDPA